MNRLKETLRLWRSFGIREQIVWTRRILPALIFTIVAAVQIWVNLTHKSEQSVWLHLSVEILVYALLGPLATWYVLLWIEKQVAEKERVERRFREQEHRLTQIADDVRAQIASDLHDSLAPNLFAIALKAEFCQKSLTSDSLQVKQELGVMSESLKQSIREVRRAIYALRPVELVRLGLFKALRKLADELEEVDQMRMHLIITGVERRLPSEMEIGLYHIVQEALHNVRRHADAKTVWVTLDVGQSVLCLTIRDDGKGFEPSTTAEGLGLIHIKERTSNLCGNCAVLSSPGEGTEIRVCMPLKWDERP